MSDNAMLSAALNYAERRWAVLPLSGKIPAIPREKGGHGYLDATTDPSIIRERWNIYAEANIGIASRKSGLLPIDVDPRHGGDERLAALVRVHRPLPDTPQVSTGSGGKHYYFRAPAHDNVPRKAGILGPGLDIPNYVVAPPSIHPGTGRAYEWYVDRDPEQARLAEAPAWLVEMTRTPNEPHGTRQVQDVSPPGWLGIVYQAVVSQIEADGGRLRPGSNGGMVGHCPLHEDRNPSFSIHPQRGWFCFGGCGEGKLTALAARLGVSIL